MLKKIIALFVIFAMLVPFSTVVAADEPSAPPTVKEILDEYHRKSLEANAAQQDGTASAYSRSASGSGKTLEQETVDQLTQAGYEAYNVTSENYNALEESLQTDFSEMGLDPEGSYIIVIEGEQSDENSGVSPAASDLLLPPHVWDDDKPEGGESFTYEYSGSTYIMRYVTVVPTEDSRQVKTCLYTFDSSDPAGYGDEIVEGFIWFLAGVTFGVCADITSIIIECNEDGNLVTLGSNGSYIFASSSWTYNYIQIYDTSCDTWRSAQLSTSANSAVEVHGAYFDDDSECYLTTKISTVTFSTYSKDYYNLDVRKEYAVLHFLSNYPAWTDLTGDITFHYTIEEEFAINQSSTPLFTLYQPTHVQH